MTEKPPVTQRNVPLSSAASPQPDDVDGMPYRTSDQASAPVINNYYITNNYACPHCINKVSDTSNHYANATATVTIDGVTTLPTAQSQTVTPKSAASAADAPTSYRTELHVQLNDEGKTVKGSGSLPQNNVVQTDYNAPSQQPLKDKPSDELSETTRQPVEGKAAPLLQSNQEKQAPASSYRQQQVGDIHVQRRENGYQTSKKSTRLCSPVGDLTKVQILWKGSGIGRVTRILRVQNCLLKTRRSHRRKPWMALATSSWKNM